MNIRQDTNNAIFRNIESELTLFYGQQRMLSEIGTTSLSNLSLDFNRIFSTVAFIIMLEITHDEK